MKKIILLFCCIFLINVVRAQNFLWAKSIGDANGQAGYSIATDASGNVYTCGYFNGTVDFDPGPGTFTFNVTPVLFSVFVSKLDAMGNFVWAKQLSSAAYTNTDIPTDIALDASGNILVSAQSAVNTFINKIDIAGNIIWTKVFGGSYCRAYSMAVDLSSNVYITGSFAGVNDFDPGPATYTLDGGGDYEIFVNKLDAFGNFVWAKQMGGINEDISQAITLDASGNIYTTGYFQGIADFDPGPGTYTFTASSWPDNDGFISKLDASGNFIWARQISGPGPQAGFGICINSAGEVLTTGHFRFATDFDPGGVVYNLTSSSSWEIYVSKLSAAGNFIWAKQMGGSDYCRGLDIKMDISNNIYTCGFMFGTVDFDPGSNNYILTANGAEDAFISKLDGAGNFLCAQLIGGLGYDKNYSIDVDPLGNILTTGIFRNTADFDPGLGIYNLSSLGGYDIFICKLNGCSSPLGINQLEEDNSISIFPNPTTGSFKIDYSGLSHGDITLSLRNALGELVYSSEFKSQDKIISGDLSNYSKGIYIVELRSDNEFIRKKVVLQ